MKVKEHDLESFLFHEMFHYETLYERTGLKIEPYGSHFRQINLGPHGISDLITIEYRKTGFPDGLPRNELNINVFELKSDEIDVWAYLQVIRYAGALRNFFATFFNTRQTYISINAILIGNKITISPIDSLPIVGVIDSVSIYTYDFTSSGIRLNEYSSMLTTDIVWNKNRGSSSFYRLFKSKIRNIISHWDCRKKMYKDNL